MGECIAQHEYSLLCVFEAVKHSGVFSDLTQEKAAFS